MSLPPSTSGKGKSTAPIDNKNLINDLWKSAKPSYSVLGRSLDYSTENAADKGDAPSVASFGAALNRKERERLLKRQAAQQKEWGVASETPHLLIPTLPTMAPSFTKAADEGVEALGGTKMGRPGYVSLISLVPTAQTVKCIEDDFELISSFRPYQHDARRAAKEAAVRENAAPHPDLLSQLRPIFQGVSPSALIDVGALPLHIFEDGKKCGNNGESDIAIKDNDGKESNKEASHPQSMPSKGTYPFVNQGRGVVRPRLPGHRTPVLGQYHPRFKVAEPRVTHGYISPQASVQPRKAEQKEEQEVPNLGTELLPEASLHFAESLMGESLARSLGDYDEKSDRQAETGSWMFTSKSQRQVERVSAAPDKMYWPFPDVRSTTKRVVCPVSFKVKTSHRRRDLQVSGVPAGVYNVTKDMGDGVHDLVMMATTTGRENHWYGKKDAAAVQAASNDLLQVDSALAAIRPHVMETKLPPRIEESTSSARDSQHEKGKVLAATVSIEKDPNFPKSYVGAGEKLHQVRSFEKMVSSEGLPHPKPLGLHLDYIVNYDLEKPRKKSVHIHPRAPGHGSLHQPHPTELGEIPNLKWVRPNHDRTTEFGAGSARPSHLLPLKDLTYHVEPGYPYVEPRVRGNPMIGTTINRAQREKIFSSKPNGAEVMYDNLDLKDKVKKVPRFEKQITKETQFCGHNIQSERWQRNNPRAPGPGYYDVKYTLVE